MSTEAWSSQNSGGYWGGVSTEPWAQQAFPVDQHYEEDDGTDTDTSSDSGAEDIPRPDVSNMTDAAAAHTIYMAYRNAKRNWRRFTGKPVRKFRRHFRRHFGKGKGKSKGKGRGFFWTQDDVQVYLKGKGKGHRSHTSGKGFGRRKNPRGRDGAPMKCHNCGSEYHFVREFPSNGKGKGSSDTGAPFSGLAFGPSDSASPVVGEGMSTEPFHEAAELYPWADDDMFHDTPSSIFASLGFGDQQPAQDPWVTQDPWSAAYHRPRDDYGLLLGPAPFGHATARESQPSMLLGHMPLIQQPSRTQSGSSSAGQQQVSPDDELSDTDLAGRPVGQQRAPNVLNPSVTPFSMISGATVPSLPLTQRASGVRPAVVEHLAGKPNNTANKDRGGRKANSRPPRPHLSHQRVWLTKCSATRQPVPSKPFNSCTLIP